jgi:hypothetical protein
MFFKFIEINYFVIFIIKQLKSSRKHRSINSTLLEGNRKDECSAIITQLMMLSVIALAINVNSSQ